MPEALLAAIAAEGSEFVILDLSAVTSQSSHTDKLENVGMSLLIKKAYSILGLISFFTTGEDETRAWTIARGAKAPQAAGVIHTDFEKKFIRAEVINWQKLLEVGSWAGAKQKVWLRLEGKEYEVKDGDVMVIRHG